MTSPEAFILEECFVADVIRGQIRKCEGRRRNELKKNKCMRGGKKLQFSWD
jgi:hypothetical protein